MALLPVVFHVLGFWLRLGGWADGFYAACGGAWVAVKRFSHSVCHGQFSGRRSRMRRALLTIRAGTWMSFRRIVPVLALTNASSARIPAALVRLYAITAATSQAEFAVNFPEGRWARALSFRSALTCSIMACLRWILSAATAPNVSAGTVVKNAWKRCVSNNVLWPAMALGFSSGMRR